MTPRKTTITSSIHSTATARSAPRSASATACTRPAALKVTDDEIDAAILAALADVGGAERPVRWSAIARRVPGTPWEQEMALVRLWHSWRIYCLKIRGRLFLSLSDASDALIVANNLGRPRPRVLPVL
jgi:hypothetical protein